MGTIGIIYIVGFIASWIIIKQVRNEVEDNTWKGVALTFFICIFSWIIVIIAAADHYDDIWKYIDEKLPKPPKWL